MKEKFHINEMINDTSIKIVGLDNEILTISLDLADFYNYNAMKYSKESQQNKIDVGDIAKLLHPYAIYKTLENAGKNTYSNTKIIEKIETPDFIEYHFNYGLILNVFVAFFLSISSLIIFISLTISDIENFISSEFNLTLFSMLFLISSTIK